MTPADLTVLKLAANGRGVLWIAAATQTSTASVQAILTGHGPCREDWQQAIDGYERHGIDLPERRPDRPTVTRNDLRMVAAEQPRLAIVPPRPEPTMTAPRIHVSCRTPKCGDLLTGGGAPRGWVLVRVIGQGTPHRYCDPVCAILALGRSGPAETPPPSTGHRGNPNPVNNSQRIGQRIHDLGLSSAVIRRWALDNGVIQTKNGALPTRAVDAYLAAHTTTTGATA